ncbi:VOC family protein, partial [Brevundimonas sp.]|uniref:VOC family protein n=1 Tax=Brevundimonas sp. TaxID=1871086 RepID=UPI00391BF51B
TSEVMAHAAAQAQAHGGELVLTDYNGYQYKILPSQGPVLRSDPFLFVSINVADLDRAADYYRTVLGMREFKGVPGAERRLRSVMLGYSEGQAKLELVQLPAGEAVQHRKAFGRVAFATRQGARPVFDRVTSTGDRVINPPIVLTTPGKVRCCAAAATAAATAAAQLARAHAQADVEVTILADRDGYEICFVGEAGFDDLSFAKPGDELIEWAARAARGGDGCVARAVLPGDAPG